MGNIKDILNSISNDDLASGGSALQKSLEIRRQFLNEGNVAVKQEIVEQPENIENTPVELPECIKNWSLEEIFEKGKLSDEDLERLKASHANDNFDDMPTDPNEMVKFWGYIERSVKEEMFILKTCPLDDEEYNKRYNRIQLKRAHQLLAEFMIGQELLSIKKQYGVKKGSKRRKKDGKVTKADVIKQRYTVNEVLDIAACASEIMKKSSPEQQNNLLGLVLKDCYLDGQKLIYTLNKPFDMLINIKNSDSWFDFDKSDAPEYENLANQVQMYKIKVEMNAEE